LVPEADDGKSPRPRVLRASPFILISCGLVFFSLIFLLDFTAQSGRGDQQADRGPMQSSVAETTKTAPATPGDKAARRVVPTPEPKPSVQGAPSSVQTEEAAVRPGKANEEPQKEEPTAPAPPTPAASNMASNTEAPGVDSQGAPPVQTVGGFTLQVGSYNDAAQAQERAARLAAVGVKSNVIRAEIPRRGTWYRVQTGRFDSRDEATRFGAQLRAKGAVADYIVTQL
jgi:cell division protein FtsN